MRQYVDLDLLAFIKAPGQREIVMLMEGKYGLGLPLEFQFVRDGAAVELPGGTTFIFGIKTAGEYDGGYLASVIVFTGPTEDLFYEAVLNLDTVQIEELLEVNDETSDDVASSTAMAELKWVPGGSGRPVATREVDFLITNLINRGDESDPVDGDPPVPSPPNIPTFYPAIVGLTGGGSTKLDGIVTVDNTAPWIALLPVEAGDVALAWQRRQLPISAISVAAAAVVTISKPHGLTSGQTVAIGGSNSTPTLNGNRVVTVLSSTTFSVPVTTTVAGSAGYATPAEDGAGGLVRPDDWDAAANAWFWQSRG